MRRLLFCLTAAIVLLLPSATAADEETVPRNRDRLVLRMRLTYLLPESFTPSAMRFPLRRNLLADLRQAREELTERPTDLEARWRVALLAEQAGERDALKSWQTALGLVEAQLGGTAPDPALPERKVEALVGANAGTRAVPAAEKLLAAQPRSWRAHLLAGDAYMCRADLNWRVVARLRQGSPEAGAAQATQMNTDLAAAEKEYGLAVEIAPAEPAPRAGRMALLFARPLMASFLPKGVLATPDRPDLAAASRELLDLAERASGAPLPLWHAALFLATYPMQAAALSTLERETLQRALSEARGEGDTALFLEEARGLLALALKDWPTARRHFLAALEAAPERRQTAGWLALAETRSGEAREQALARVRARVDARPSAEDWTVLGVLLAEEERPAAVDALRKALAVDVTNASARYNLGILLLRDNLESTEARHHLGEVWKSGPDDREAELTYLLMQAMDGKFEAASHALEEMLRLQELDEDMSRRVADTLKELASDSKVDPEK